ncbi:hypothetical protein F4604DRAFT_1927437 [Suillus subluteus]|nr:hypothetical protein F4604DRAFT_1927437 [Suillus subluteus]
MNPSTYSTEHPIVLNIKSHSSAVANEVMTKVIALEVDRVNVALKMSIDEESCNVPSQYYDALWLLIHHLRVYQRTAMKLMEHAQLDSAQATYTSIAYYYCEVLLAFVKEVKDGWRRKSKKWRSAHVDYHFAMAMHANAFLEPMQKATLKKINRTWDDFKQKKIYQPVTELTIHSYHDDFCDGKDMCGVPHDDHDLSVEDMISSVLKQSNEQLGQAIKAGRAKKKNVKTTLRPIDSAISASTSSHAVDDGMHDATNMADKNEDASRSKTTQRGGRRTKATRIASPMMDDLIDMAPISFKAHDDLRNARKHAKGADQSDSSDDMSPVDEDAIDEAANMFQEEEDGQKGRKPRKGGRQEKDNIGRATADRKSSKGRSKRPSKKPKAKAKSQAIVISDDENLDGHATSQEVNDNTDLAITNESTARARLAAESTKISSSATAVRHSIAVNEQEKEDIDGIITIQSSPIAMRPQSRARIAGRKGKGKAIVLSDDEADGGNPELPPCGQSKQHLEQPQRIHDVDDVPDLNILEATSDIDNSEDTNFPSTLEDWEEWNHIAFEKGNSQMFLKLGAWILVRFRQLTQTPIHGNVEGLLIPDHPASFDIESEADFNEALGMTRLYSALTHVDTHPQYLAHLFHELGKASSEGRLECSHPDLRQLPEPPTPVLSMMADEQLPWLKALPLEEFVDSVDMDADGEFDDGDGDGDVSISMALDDMNISGMHDSVEVVDGQDVPKRKRTTSKALSPPKVDGGRGCPKRSRASHNGSFHRPSSPVVKSTSGRARTKTLQDGSTRDDGIPIQVIHFVDHRSGFAFPESEGDEIVPGSETIPDEHSIPSSTLCDTGVVSDISAWSESEESRMQISSHSEGDEVAGNSEDPTNGMSGLGTVSTHDSDGLNIGQAVNQDHQAAGQEMSGSRGISESSIGDAHALDEDVRVFVPSTPE